MKKELKDQIINSISEQIKEYPNFYITDISGLNAEQTTKLRRACFENQVKLTVVKNTLFEHVIKENEAYKDLIPTLVGNTAIMYTTVPNAPGKLIKKLQKEGFEKPVIKGAYVQDCVYLGAESLDTLAAIKTREELIGDIRGHVALADNKRNGTFRIHIYDEGAVFYALLKSIKAFFL